MRVIIAIVLMMAVWPADSMAGTPSQREAALAAVTDPLALEILRFVPAPPPKSIENAQPSPDELAKLLNTPNWRGITELMVRTEDVRRRIIRANLSLPVPEADPRKVQILLFYGIYKPWQDASVCEILRLQDAYQGWVEVRPYFMPRSMMQLENIRVEDYPCFNSIEAQFDMNGSVAQFFGVRNIPIAVIRHQGQMRITEWSDVKPVVGQIAKLYQ